MYFYNQNNCIMNFKISGVKIKYAIGILLFYLFFMLFYYLTLSYSFSDYKKNEPIYSLANLIFQFVDYFLKFLVTLPIWYLIFRFFRKKSLSFRIFLHFLTMPIFILGWQKLYYFSLESFHYSHLTGSGQVWDIYIPGLFYCIQFGVLHAFEYYNDNIEQQKI